MSWTGVIALGLRVVVTLLHHGVLCSYRSFISGLFWGVVGGGWDSRLNIVDCHVRKVLQILLLYDHLKHLALRLAFNFARVV